ncbi:MAG: hypothetical protein E6J90_33785, partial [Deltaproteobacteria bacterium]
MRRAAVALVSLAGLASCAPLHADFVCTDDASCVSASGAQGTCEANHRCSLLDSTCPSGHRYADASGSLSNQCTTGAACIAALRAGARTTCALKTDGSVWCWGAGTRTPASLALPAGDVAQIELGGDGICARYAGGDVYCAPDPHQPMAKVPDVAALQLSVGGGHACAVTTDQHVKCWGMNGSGELGDGTRVMSTTAVTVAQLAGVRQVAAGVASTCVITDAGAVWCWGNDDKCQLGRGIDFPPSDPTLPLKVDDDHLIASSVTVADQFACALTTGGAVMCWGGNSLGQLGDRSPGGSSDTPNRIPSLTGVTQLSAGGSHACAVVAGGATCWGKNDVHQTASTAVASVPAPSPVAVPAPLELQDVASGTDHTCGLARDGAVICWGDNTSGEIGDGTVMQAVQP